MWGPYRIQQLAQLVAVFNIDDGGKRVVLVINFDDWLWHALLEVLLYPVACFLSFFRGGGTASNLLSVEGT